MGNIKIRKYNESRDAVALFEMMRLEDDWGEYSNDKKSESKYKIALNNDIVYVAYEDDSLCGFIRVRNDHGYGVYIHDLLVHKNYRGKSYGKALIEHVCKNHKGTVYVMSDVDDYYHKQGYTEIEGRIIIVRK